MAKENKEILRKAWAQIPLTEFNIETTKSNFEPFAFHFELKLSDQELINILVNHFI